LELQRENEIAENKNWLLRQRPLRDEKLRSDHSSTVIAVNGENRVKIRAVEVGITGPTEIV